MKMIDCRYRLLPFEAAQGQHANRRREIVPLLDASGPPTGKFDVLGPGAIAVRGTNVGTFDSDIIGAWSVRCEIDGHSPVIGAAA